MDTHFTDLPLDVLSKIISDVAKGPDGARDVAKSMCLSKLFLECSKSLVVREAVCFDNVQVLPRIHLFQNSHGLLYLCAMANNSSAMFHLSQVIMTTTTQLAERGIYKGKNNPFINCNGEAVESDVTMSFLSHLSPGMKVAPPRYHWYFVKAFLKYSNPIDIITMSRHIVNYAAFFSAGECGSDDVRSFLNHIQYWWEVCHVDKKKVMLDYNLDDLPLLKVPTALPQPKVMFTTELFEELRTRTLRAFAVLVPKLK